MNKRIKWYFVAAIGGFLLLAGCKKWENHNRIVDGNMSVNLLQRIQADPNLSSFAEMLSRTGYDDTLASSRVYTVYAPDNAALQAVAAGLGNDLEAVKKFVANHIANQAYYTASTAGAIRVKVLSGKYHDITASAIDEVSFASKDLVARNGVMHVLKTALPVMGNSWDFAATDARMPVLQRLLMIDSLGGLFRTRVQDLQDESKNFTLIVLQDNAWKAEVDKLKPYSMVPGNADSTGKIAGWLVVKDLVLDTLYNTAADIPDTVTSRSGVRIGINKGAIVSSIKTSNGRVYVLNSLDVRLRDKFKSIVIQAENYTSVSANRTAQVFIRDKRDSATGGVFRDLMAYNHGLALFNFRYRLTEIPSLKYRAYWMALNDNINGMTAPFSQKIGVDSINSPTPAYSVVQLNTYAEQFAGEFTLTQYRPVFNLYLVAANNTTANTNAIVCNYIRLEPVF